MTEYELAEALKDISDRDAEEYDPAFAASIVRSLPDDEIARIHQSYLWEDLLVAGDRNGAH